MKRKTLLLSLGALCLASSCTIGTRSDPPRLQSKGLVKGHVALGIAAEDRLLHARLFGGHSDGSLLELVIWKLLRIELGVAGASLTIGPLHLGIGVLAYDADVPRMSGSAKHQREHLDADDADDADFEAVDGQGLGVEGCAECEAALKGRD